MSTGSRIERRAAATLRTAAFVLLACALLAPKVSLALASAIGNGYTSVIICTGGGLARVTVTPDGEIVEDVTERWRGFHCVLSDESTERLRRAWQAGQWPPALLHLADRPFADRGALPRVARPASLSRAPPAA